MRFEGTVSNWNDERGFGHIQPGQGGVHGGPEHARCAMACLTLRQTPAAHFPAVLSQARSDGHYGQAGRCTGLHPANHRRMFKALRAKQRQHRLHAGCIAAHQQTA